MYYTFLEALDVYMTLGDHCPYFLNHSAKNFYYL